jgi:hypothetical protein
MPILIIALALFEPRVSLPICGGQLASDGERAVLTSVAKPPEIELPSTTTCEKLPSGGQGTGSTTTISDARGDAAGGLLLIPPSRTLWQSACVQPVPTHRSDMDVVIADGRVGRPEDDDPWASAAVTTTDH